MRAARADLGRPALNVTTLRQRLVGPGLPLARLELVSETGSTNADLAALVRAGADDLPDRTLLVTEHQQAGRGRLGRTWQTPARSALTMSLLLRPPAQTQSGWPWLTLICGLATVQVLRRHAGLQAALKWPNDVLVPPASEPGRPPAEPSAKVAGILAEIVQSPLGEPVVIVGLGLNVSITTSEFAELAAGFPARPATSAATSPAAGPPVSALSAASLATAGAATTDRSVLLRAIVRRWIELDDRWRAHNGDAGASGLADEVREHCITLGRQVRVSVPAGAPLVGTAEGIDRDGRLLIDVDQPATGVVAAPRSGLGGRVGSARRRVPVAAGDVEHVRSLP